MGVAAHLRRLTRAYAEALDRTALYELLRADVARAILAMSDPENTDPGAPRLDSTPFTLSYRGQNWEVRLQDVQGLVDVFTAPDVVWRRLGVDPAQLAARRTRALEGWPEGARLPTLEASMAAFALPEELRPWLTQEARERGFNASTIPPGLRPYLSSVDARLMRERQTTLVQVELTRAE